jgi:hypothetical protein
VKGGFFAELSMVFLPPWISLPGVTTPGLSITLFFAAVLAGGDIAAEEPEDAEK